MSAGSAPRRRADSGTPTRIGSRASDCSAALSSRTSMRCRLPAVVSSAERRTAAARSVPACRRLRSRFRRARAGRRVTETNPVSSANEPPSMRALEADQKLVMTRGRLGDGQQNPAVSLIARSSELPEMPVSSYPAGSWNSMRARLALHDGHVDRARPSARPNRPSVTSVMTSASVRTSRAAATGALSRIDHHTSVAEPGSKRRFDDGSPVGGRSVA